LFEAIVPLLKTDKKQEEGVTFFIFVEITNLQSGRSSQLSQGQGIGLHATYNRTASTQMTNSKTVSQNVVA